MYIKCKNYLISKFHFQRCAKFSDDKAFPMRFEKTKFLCQTCDIALRGQRLTRLQLSNLAPWVSNIAPLFSILSSIWSQITDTIWYFSKIDQAKLCFWTLAVPNVPNIYEKRNNFCHNYRFLDMKNKTKKISSSDYDFIWVGSY